MIRLLVLLTVLAAQGAKSREREPWTFRDIEDKVSTPLESKSTKAIVVIFVTTDCPISNYYQPTVRRLEKQFGEQGVKFFLCHSNAKSDLSEIKTHRREFRIQIPVVLDKDQKIARRLGARVTPEAFLIDRQGKVIYRGRIDDLYVDFGKRRRAATKYDLRDALHAHLKGRKISPAKTKAVGCYIDFLKKPKQ